MAVALQPSLRFHHNSAFFPKCPRIFRNSQLRPNPGFATARIRASSAVALEPESIPEAQSTSDVELFACPICYEPLIRKGPSGFNLQAIYRSGFKCKKCNKSYSSKNIYLDLTVTSGTKEYSEFQPAGTELFRSPFVSFVYERGWRQNFNLSGFPGPDEEFNMAQEYFKPAEGGFLVDVSCGSGLFSRKFAKSGTYSRVVALDFSENMLRQSFDFIKNDDTILNTNIALVRADVARLPFSSGSVDAVHAGAALHCWPSPSNAIAEINRILRSGGIFVGSTFLRVTSSTPAWLRPFRQRGTSSYNYLTEEEIEDLCKSCGLINYTKKASPSIEQGRVEDIVDANLLVHGCNMEMMLKMGQLALRCVVKEPKERPTMTQVWQELEKALNTIDDLLPRHRRHLAEDHCPILCDQPITSREIPQLSDNDYSHSIGSVDGIGLERFHVDVDDGLSFRSASLRCLSISVDEDFSIPR